MEKPVARISPGREEPPRPRRIDSITESAQQRGGGGEERETRNGGEHLLRGGRVVGGGRTRRKRERVSGLHNCSELNSSLVAPPEITSPRHSHVIIFCAAGSAFQSLRTCRTRRASLTNFAGVHRVFVNEPQNGFALSGKNFCPPLSIIFAEQRIPAAGPRACCELLFYSVRAATPPRYTRARCVIAASLARYLVAESRKIAADGLIPLGDSTLRRGSVRATATTSTMAESQFRQS